MPDPGIKISHGVVFPLEAHLSAVLKWTYQALKELDAQGEFSGKIQELADTRCDRGAWEGTKYHPNRPNFKDRIISLAEEIASEIADMLIGSGLTDARNYYLERYVDYFIE